MGLDYYHILGCKESDSDEAIKKAYQSLSIKCHPIIAYDGVGNAEKFSLVSEAFDVLSHPKLRSAYDQFGEEGLKNGVPLKSFLPTKYEYHGDPYRTFQEFFGSDNPYTFMKKKSLKNMYDKFGWMDENKQVRQDPSVEHELLLSLEEIFSGCTRKMKISRRVYNAETKTFVIKDKVLTLNIKPGCHEGTRITFPKEGDQSLNSIPGDIVFVLRDQKHEFFRRNGDDLIYTAVIPLSQALIGCILDIVTLDKRIVRIPITEVIHPKYVKKVIGEGMPRNKEKTEKGDLLIEFDITFPKILTYKQRLLIEEAFFPTTFRMLQNCNLEN